jgi:hypothetical protein
MQLRFVFGRLSKKSYPTLDKPRSLYLTSSRQPLLLARKCKVDPPVSFTAAWNIRYTPQTLNSCSKASVKNLVELTFFQARCIADVIADLGHTSFLAGTLSLKEENEVLICKISDLNSSYLLSVNSLEFIRDLIVNRFTWFGYRHLVMRLYARVCSTIRTRSGI